MNAQKPLMGFCPIGKFVFSNEDAIRLKIELQKKLNDWHFPHVDLEGILEDGLVKDQSHVDAVVSHFQKENVDCLFMPHCNFGTEGAVGMIAKKLDVPTLLWGPRDEAPLPDGTRLRDTLCGLFASSKVLHKLQVPFSYIENCRIDDTSFQDGIDQFVRAANVANVFKKRPRIGLIGQRIDFFWSTIVNETELLQKFGLEILPFDMVDFIKAAQQMASQNEKKYKQEISSFRKEWVVEGLDDEPFVNILAVRDQMLSLADINHLDGIAFQTFMSVIEATGAYCILAESQVAEQIPFSLESDIHGVVSDMLLRRANFNQTPCHLSEFTIRHPENEDGVMLWHAGAPLSFCHPQEKIRLGHHWILKSPYSGMLHFKMKDGPITIARFDGDGSDYQLAIGEGRTITGPKTLNNYAWLQVDHWPKWERTLIEGPFIHHVAMAYGNYKETLIEACKFLPGVSPIPLGD